MGETPYPPREKFFAHRYSRLLFRCCVANEIGPEACYMLVQIAHTEDAAHYRKPVTFFNEQLINVCGFRNVKALARARSKAVESGWLNYTAGGKSKPGRYFVTIPASAEHLPDKSIESDLHPGSVVENDLTNGREAGDKREVNGREAGDKRATFFPSPIPNPSPLQKPGGALNWEREEKAAIIAELKERGLGRAIAAANDAERAGITPEGMRDILFEYDENRSKFRSTGALSERIKTGHWPADGVLTGQKAAEKAVQRNDRKAEKSLDDARYDYLWRTVRTARAEKWTEDQILAKLREKLPVEYLKKNGYENLE